MVCKIAVCFCNKKLDLLFLLNWIVVSSLPTAMSSLTENHTMDLFCLLKKNFKNLLLDLLNRKELRQFVLFMKFFVATKMKIRKNTLEPITKHWIRPCLQKNISRLLPIHFVYGLKACDTHEPVACWKISAFFISNFKTNVCFLSTTAQLGAAKNQIN